MIKEDLDYRALLLAKYICRTNATIRETAKVFMLGKSTVHCDITKRVARVSPIVAVRIRQILQDHIATRALHGGQATKEKYEKRRVENE